jgi:hypothetical protein
MRTKKENEMSKYLLDVVWPDGSSTCLPIVDVREMLRLRLLKCSEQDRSYWFDKLDQIIADPDFNDPLQGVSDSFFSNLKGDHHV